MLKCINSFILFFCITQYLYAQNSNDSLFVQWLYAKGKYPLALAESQRLYKETGSAKFHLISNKCFFKLKEYKKITFPTLSNDSTTYFKECLLNYGTHCFLDSVEPSSCFKIVNDYTNLYKRIFYLKQKNYNSYTKQTNNNPIFTPALASLSVHLEDNYSEYQRYMHKKPFVASCLSAVIPGMGKVYAHRPTEIIGPLVKSIILGLLTYEGYRKNKFQSAQFYSFGSLFLFTYSSSIYGSYKAVQINKKDYENKYYDELAKTFNAVTVHLID